MKSALIHKTPSQIGASNLPNYQSAYTHFSQSDAQKEIFYKNGKTNAAYNALDRHLNTWRKNKIAYYWSDGVSQDQNITFQQLNDKANQWANALHELNIDQGDRVFFFLSRTIELYAGFLGTLKRGAIAGTMFAAFGPQAIQDRLENSGAKVLVTEPTLFPRLKTLAHKLPDLQTIVITGDPKIALRLKLPGKKVVAYNDLVNSQSQNYETRLVDPETPAFMLYTSGTTGKPKGVVHSHQAIIHQHVSTRYVLDLKDDDIYWCTADPGWVTGISYGILGPLSNGVSSVIFNGRFEPDIWYGVLEKYRVTVWYSAPTAIRMLEAAGDAIIKKRDLSSLRHLCSVGEPLNPEPIRWSLKVFGLPFHDTWWQTETGGILIANYISLPIKPGSMGKPLPGITAAIVSDEGKVLGHNQEGNLAIKPGWPSMMKTIWKRPAKFDSYFTKGWYFSGDRAFTDKDGYFWFIGRADDVIKTSGERVGPFEVESALIEHPKIIEAGVIGKPDPLRGEIIKAFVKLTPGTKPSEALKADIQQFIKHHLAGHAYPREIEFVDTLPKTRSGKIMRRLLKAKELGLPIGDTSTLEEY